MIQRVSLYPHELETIAKLTVDLARLHIVDEENKDCAANIGPEIFGKLVAILYGPVSTIVRASFDWQADAAPGSVVFGDRP